MTTPPQLYTLVIAPTEMGKEIELLRFPTRYAHSAGAYAHWVLTQALETGGRGYMRYILQILDLETALVQVLETATTAIATTAFSYETVQKRRVLCLTRGAYGPSRWDQGTETATKCES